jgi:chromosome segregation ATPase
VTEGPVAAVLDLWAVKIMAPLMTFAGGIWISRANIMNAVTRRVNDLIGHLEAEIKRLTVRCERAEQRCQSAEDAHRDCEARVTEMRTEIDGLMSGRVPGYINPKTPRRDP